MFPVIMGKRCSRPEVLLFYPSESTVIDPLLSETLESGDFASHFARERAFKDVPRSTFDNIVRALVPVSAGETYVLAWLVNLAVKLFKQRASFLGTDINIGAPSDVISQAQEVGGGSRQSTSSELSQTPHNISGGDVTWYY